MQKAQFVNQIILEDVTLRQASSKQLQVVINQRARRRLVLATKSYASVLTYIYNAFQRRQKIIFNLIKNAKSLVYLSFNLQTASNRFNYISIVSYFVNSKGLKRNVPISLLHVVSLYSSENITTYIKKVINCYELGLKLGYFVLNNASTNNICLEALALQFPIDVNKRRLRYISYIINFVVRAVIFNKNVSKLKDEL